MSTTLVAEEGEPRETFLLERGDYLSPSGPVLQPGVIAAIGGMPSDSLPKSARSSTMANGSGQSTRGPRIGESTLAAGVWSRTRENS